MKEKKMKWTNPSLKNISEELKIKNARGIPCANGSVAADVCGDGADAFPGSCTSGTSAFSVCSGGGTVG